MSKEKTEVREVGYRACSCPDCFQLIVGVLGDVCSDCEDCDLLSGPPGAPRAGMCQNPHSYGGIDGSGHCGDPDCRGGTHRQ